MRTRSRFLPSIFVVTLAFSCLACPLAGELSPQEGAPIVPSSPQPGDVTPPEGPPASGSVIPGLASIQVLGVPYTDDDSTYGGVAVAILFLNAQMGGIDFQGVPLEVQVELYAYRNPMDLTTGEGELVYQGEYSVDHSPRPEEFDQYIRIPYEEVGIDPAVHIPLGRVRVVVETPNQGTFEGSMSPVPLTATSP